MEENSFEDLIENLFDGVYYVDRNRTITYWNAGAERITGYARDDVLGKTCAANILRHIDDTGTELCHNGCPLAATLVDGQNREISVYLHHNSGHRLPVSVRVSPLRDADGNITGAAEVFTENAELHQVLKDLEALRFKVNRDELTGVSNRRAAEAALKTRLFELQQFGTPLGLIFLDIDHFKHINDTYGHAVGDQVLRLAANTITAALHRGDLLARWGGWSARTPRLRHLGAKPSFKHLTSNPARGSACKRWFLFLRWMVRPADGLDLGLWRRATPAKLLYPVDRHVLRIANNLGVVSSKQASLRVARAITAFFREIDPADPVRYDFALCHLGILGACPTAPDVARCSICELAPMCQLRRRLERRAGRAVTSRRSDQPAPECARTRRGR